MSIFRALENLASIENDVKSDIEVLAGRESYRYPLLWNGTDKFLPSGDYTSPNQALGWFQNTTGGPIFVRKVEISVVSEIDMAQWNYNDMFDSVGVSAASMKFGISTNTTGIETEVVGQHTNADLMANYKGSVPISGSRRNIYSFAFEDVRFDVPNNNYIVAEFDGDRSNAKSISLALTIVYSK